MPSSDHNTISPILEIIRQAAPKSVLDIGVGCGKYGMLVREYLDGHWTNRAFHKKETWETLLVGIEIWADYVTPLHEYLYDEVLVVEAFEHLKNHTGAFDLILMGDVIEHFPRDKGFELIEILRTKWLNKGGHLVISTPNFQTQINNESLAVFGNKHEVHRSRWEAKDFKDLGMSHRVTAERHIIADLINE